MFGFGAPSSHGHAILAGVVLVGVTLLFGTLAIRRRQAEAGS
jgi:hypothetical protein